MCLCVVSVCGRCKGLPELSAGALASCLVGQTLEAPVLLFTYPGAARSSLASASWASGRPCWLREPSAGVRWAGEGRRCSGSWDLPRRILRPTQLGVGRRWVLGLAPYPLTSPPSSCSRSSYSPPPWGTEFPVSCQPLEVTAEAMVSPEACGVDGGPSGRLDSASLMQAPSLKVPTVYSDPVTQVFHVQPCRGGL